MPRGVSGLHEEPELDAKAAAWSALEALVKDDVKAICQERGLATNDAATKQELIRLAVSDNLRAHDLNLGQLHRIAAHGTNAVAWFKTMRRAELLAIVAAFGLPVDVKAKDLHNLITKELARDQYRFASQRAKSSYQHALEAELALYEEESKASAASSAVVDATAYLAALNISGAGLSDKCEVPDQVCKEIAKYIETHFGRHSGTVVKIVGLIQLLASRGVPPEILINTVHAILINPSPADALKQAQNGCALMLGN